MKKILSFNVIIVLSAFVSSFAQVDTARFKLNYNATVGSFSKINNEASLNDTTTSKVKFDYYIIPDHPELNFKTQTMMPAKLTSDPVKRLYRDFLKIGFGYPLTPVLELSIHNPDNHKYSYGLNLYHFSSWAKQTGREMKELAYAPTSDTRATIFLNTFFSTQTLYSSVTYNHILTNFYNIVRDTAVPAKVYDSKEFINTLDNSFHHLNANIGLRSNFLPEDKKVKQDVKLLFDWLHGLGETNEAHVGLSSFVAYDARFMKISGSQNYRLDVNFDYWYEKFGKINLYYIDSNYNIKNENNYPLVPNDYSLLFELKPTVQFTIKEYHLLFGLGLPVAYNLQAGTKVPIYPIAEVQLGIINGILSIYAGIEGKTYFNSLQKIVYENPFVKHQIDSLRFTSSQISIYGGIKGNLVKKLNYHLSARYSIEKNHLFYVVAPDTSHKYQFGLSYKNVQILNLNFNMNWQVLSHLFLNLDANYWGYYFEKSTDIAYYAPQWTAGFNGKYILKEKMIFGLNFDIEFGRKGMDYTGNTVKMKPVINIGAGFEYLFTKKFSAFVTANNIANQHYSQYFDFKAYGINVLLGITYSFGDESIKKNR